MHRRISVKMLKMIRRMSGSNTMSESLEIGSRSLG